MDNMEPAVESKNGDQFLHRKEVETFSHSSLSSMLILFRARQVEKCSMCSKAFITYHAHVFKEELSKEKRSVAVDLIENREHGFTEAVISRAMKDASNAKENVLRFIVLDEKIDYFKHCWYFEYLVLSFVLECLDVVSDIVLFTTVRDEDIVGNWTIYALTLGILNIIRSLSFIVRGADYCRTGNLMVKLRASTEQIRAPGSKESSTYTLAKLGLLLDWQHFMLFFSDESEDIIILAVAGFRGAQIQNPEETFAFITSLLFSIRAIILISILVLKALVKTKGEGICNRIGYLFPYAVAYTVYFFLIGNTIALLSNDVNHNSAIRVIFFQIPVFFVFILALLFHLFNPILLLLYFLVFKNDSHHSFIFQQLWFAATPFGSTTMSISYRKLKELSAIAAYDSITKSSS